MERRAGVPIRGMIPIETPTYGESLISTPSSEMLLPSGPMQNGITYMVRPRMHPSKISANVSRISAGAIRFLVAPASSSRSAQMNVRSSTRATPSGSDTHQKLFGRSSGLSLVNVPLSTSRLVSRSHSSGEPSHQTTASGLVSSAIWRTHAASSGRLVFSWLSGKYALNIVVSPASVPASGLSASSAASQKRLMGRLSRRGGAGGRDGPVDRVHHDLPGRADQDGLGHRESGQVERPPGPSGHERERCRCQESVLGPRSPPQQ